MDPPGSFSEREAPECVSLIKGPPFMPNPDACEKTALARMRGSSDNKGRRYELLIAEAFDVPVAYVESGEDVPQYCKWFRQKCAF